MLLRRRADAFDSALLLQVQSELSDREGVSAVTLSPTPEEIAKMIMQHISNCVECQILSVRIRAHAIKIASEA